MGRANTDTLQTATYERSGQVNVLHIEDSLADMILFRHMLNNSNGSYDITNAQRVVDAFNFIDEMKFDVIVLDLNLLDMDGLACIAAINSKIPETPIVIHSGSLDESLKGAAFLCGAKRFVNKNTSNTEILHEAISEVLEN